MDMNLLADAELRAAVAEAQRENLAEEMKSCMAECEALKLRCATLEGRIEELQARPVAPPVDRNAMNDRLAVEELMVVLKMALPILRHRRAGIRSLSRSSSRVRVPAPR